MTQQMITFFSDPRGGAFYLSAGDVEPLIIKNRPAYDGAVPSGNSVAAKVLLQMGRLCMNEIFTTAGRSIFENFYTRFSERPTALTCLLQAYDYYIYPTREVTIAGNEKDPRVRDMTHHIQQRFLPRTLVVLRRSGLKDQDLLGLIPYIKEQVSMEGLATAYVCRNYECQNPVHSTGELMDLLDNKPAKIR